MYQSVTQNTSINADLNASGIGTLLKTWAAEADSLWAVIENLATQNDITTATGSGLDTWGSNLGVPRLTSQKASSLGYARSITFTNLTSQSLTVQSGVRVWSSKNVQAAFFTIENVNIGPGQSLPVHVVAADVGESFNIPAGYIDSSSLVTNVIVTNVLPITNGQSTESDDDYRVRLVSEFRRRNVFNSAICLNLITSKVPNVQDALIIDQPRGPGTFDVIVVPVIMNDLSSTLTAVNSILSDNVQLGSDYTVRGPIFRNLDIGITLTFNSSVVNKQQIRNSVVTQIQNLINGQPVENGQGNSLFYINQIFSIANNVDSSITNVAMTVGLDSLPLDNQGYVVLNLGEVLNLRSIVVN